MKEKVAVFTEKCECSDLFTIAENKYRTEASLYKDKKIVMFIYRYRSTIYRSIDRDKQEKTEAGSNNRLSLN